MHEVLYDVKVWKLFNIGDILPVPANRDGKNFDNGQA